MTKIISSSLLSKELQKRIKLEVSNLKQSKRVLSKTELSEEAKAFLDTVVNGSWTQRPDGKIDVEGGVNAASNKDIHLFMRKEIFFGEVRGFFHCHRTNITSLEGSPEKVGGDFRCRETNITSLEGAPEKVGGDFDCSYAKITSLEGAPKKVGGNFDCERTNITSLEGAPREVGEDFICMRTKITSLEGAPKKVGGDFYCNETNITSLEGIGEVKGKIYHDLKQTRPKGQKMSVEKGQKMSVEKLLPYFVNEYKVLEKKNQNSMLSEFAIRSEFDGTGEKRYDFEYDINENKKEQAKNMKDVKETVSKLIKILKKEGINEVTVSFVDKIPLDTDQFGSDLKNGDGGSYNGLGNIYAINNIPESLIESLNYYYFAGNEVLYEPYEDEDNSYPENTFFFVLGASQLTIIAKEYDEDEDDEDED